MKKTVKFTLTTTNHTEITEANKAEIKALADMPDGAIDFSDIPQSSSEAWDSAISNPFYRPKKTSTTVRVDSDVLLWLKSKGKGYQTKINGILRDAMLRDIKH